MQTPPQADDFSQEKPIVSLADPVALQLDESCMGCSAWRGSAASTAPTRGERNPARRRVLGAPVFAPAPPPPGSSPAREPSSANRRREYQEAFAVGTQAADGMSLDRSYASTGTSLADLDSEAVFNKHAVEEIASLADLRKAPLVEEEYHGPLLMSADAATDTLRSLLAGGGRRPRGPPWARKRAPTAHLPPAITRAFCPIS